MKSGSGGRRLLFLFQCFGDLGMFQHIYQINIKRISVVEPEFKCRRRKKIPHQLEFEILQADGLFAFCQEDIIQPCDRDLLNYFFHNFLFY